eukprot:1822044-Rhodomonas_salina.2
MVMFAPIVPVDRCRSNFDDMFLSVAFPKRILLARVNHSLEGKHQMKASQAIRTLAAWVSLTR